MSVSVDISSAIAGIQNWQRKLRPALSTALTKTALQARDGVRQGVKQRFTLRHESFILRIKITPSNPSSLTAEVRVDLDFMGLQESGGIKVSRKGGGHFIAVPMAPELKGSRAIPPSLRPAFLLRNADINGGPKRFPGKRALATYGVGFILRVGNKHFIVSRVRPGRLGLKFWYYLAPSTVIHPRLFMKQTVERVVGQNLQTNLRTALEGIAD